MACLADALGMQLPGSAAIPAVDARRYATAHRAGIQDMVRISDARMSGTGFGTGVLHVAPEAAAGVEATELSRRGAEVAPANPAASSRGWAVIDGVPLWLINTGDWTVVDADRGIVTVRPAR